jgi:hypothetical protein
MAQSVTRRSSSFVRRLFGGRVHEFAFSSFCFAQRA